MNIGFSIFWRFQLNNKFNVRNIKTSCSNIGSYQDLELVVLEPFDGDFSLILSNISMHDFNIMSDLIREQQRIGISLGGSKDNNPTSTPIAIHYSSKLKVSKLTLKIKS
jgi:hypothetical protein